MTQTPQRSTLVKAVAVAWAGVILATLIMTYGAHGPAKHPKVFLVFAIVLGPLVAGVLQAKSKAVLWTQGLIFLGALIVSTIVSDSGDSLPPIATTLVLCLCAAISIGAMAISKIDESPDEETNPDS